MKNLELRASLIKSGILLGLCIFFIYAFAAGDSGGIGGTIASLFSGLIFLVGLAVALIVSVLVLIGIYFGILSMYDKDVCKKTYEEFKDKVAALSGPLGAKCCSRSEEVATAPVSDEELTPLRTAQNRQDSQLTSLQDGVDSVTATLSSLSASVNALKEELANMEVKATTVEEALENKASVDSVDDSAKKLAADISGLQNTITPLSDKLTQLEETLATSEPAEEEESDILQEKIDQAVGGLQSELAAVKESIAEIVQAQPATEDEATSNEESHRILSYFTNKNDQKKFVALVDEAVAKGMTYAQVAEFLDDSLSAKATGIISDHPSLTKDYIRDIRQLTKK